MIVSHGISVAFSTSSVMKSFGGFNVSNMGADGFMNLNSHTDSLRYRPLFWRIVNTEVQIPNHLNLALMDAFVGGPLFLLPLRSCPFCLEFGSSI